ncbi:Ornithine/acetylornithine aminotransferase [Legionella massiliensis]|uniref:Ornithine/acetylornithine aminotransferase n=1 Tax=Legionella massiliensis TaxID=1034943 RepID=A0A078L1Y5_9GAMM|nr:helicase HerA-like domain-containing protein [Legionella massiliensis]CDZ78033.1 Ornithine/acetylornithine aminotransferase [Legionella massiliensis]CEE13771.1 AAA-like domain protein [Legionella massiliensis]
MYEDLRIPYAASDLPSVQLGGILLKDKLLDDSPVNLVLKSLNRHGLIAGATGSGKTKTIQVLSEQLSLLGVPSLVMDIKGDVSGLAESGEENPALAERAKGLGLTFNPRAFPVEFLSLNDSPQEGVPLRSTVSDFGAVLFSRMLDINDTQAGVVTIIFEYAKANNLPLIDLADLKALLQFAQTDEGKEKVEANFGGVSAATVGTIMRKLIELEAQGGDKFFGEPAFKVLDLVRTNEQGHGIISILRLMDMQDKPKLFSTFMLKLLSDVYRQMPELGDPPKPKLVLFIDEAHLIFSNASKALLSLLDTMVKLIRSKGIGLIFCTQTPNDIPDAVLSQLGLKIQHALRAFTAKDRKAMKLVAQNFPSTNYYDTEQLLTALGIGEALVSGLDAKGQPTPLVECRVRAPESRMGVISQQELAALVAQSSLIQRYGTRVETSSAQEILAAQREAERSTVNGAAKPNDSAADSEESMVEKISKNTLFRQVIRQIMRDLTRSLLSALGIKRR